MNSKSAPGRWLLLICLSMSTLSTQAGLALTSLPILKQDSIIIQKLNNNNKHTINIYTNSSQQVLFFSASSEEGSAYQLLLFRQEGRLIKSSKIRNRETAVVSKPEKGNYFYEVYSNNICLEKGTIVVQ